MLGPDLICNTGDPVYTDEEGLSSKCRYIFHYYHHIFATFEYLIQRWCRTAAPTSGSLWLLHVREWRAFPFLAALVEHMAPGCFHTWIKATAVTRSGAVDGWKLMRAFKGVSGVKGTQCLSWGSQATEMGSNALACALKGTACCV